MFLLTWCKQCGKVRWQWSLIVSYSIMLGRAAAVQLYGNLPDMRFGEINLVATTDTHAFRIGHAMS
eukprot:5751649-Amphidinium_carterae.1